MTNGKTLILFMTPLSFLTVLWKNLFKGRKDYADSRILYDLHKKGEHWDWVSSDGIHISRKRVFLSKVYYLSLRLGKYFPKLKSKVKELPWLLLKLMVNLCGVLALVCVILTCVLLLPLLANSKLSGNVSPGIEPWAANVFTEQGAKELYQKKSNVS